jgi:segregation and condensation protein A
MSRKRRDEPGEVTEVERPPGFRALEVTMEGFEGPLDLLLHLIRKHEIDITNIPIAFITEEYLRYLDAMQSLDLGVAGEYLVMAATLLQIKSQMLLPQAASVDSDDGDEDGEDPRAALVARLLEYQRYKDAAGRLGGRELMGRDVFARPSRANAYEADAGPPDLLPVSLYQLLEALNRLLTDRPAEKLHEITPAGISLRATIARIAEHLQEHPRVTLLELVYLHGPEPTRNDIVITFLALLELAKMRMVKLFQARISSNELFVERSVVDYEEVAQQLDGIEEPS